MGKIKKIKFLILTITLILIGAVPVFADAASLFFSPSSGSYAVGGTVVVNVNVSSTDQSMNAASGTINFPQDKLQVVSLSKADSICDLWVQEPSFSNVYGTVSFECIVLNPGFQGSLGKILTINFTSKNSGSASLNFSSASVLANDGSGTNILTNSGSASFSLGEKDTNEPPTFSVPIGTLLALKIQSSSHPDESRWYATNKAEFSWVLPKDATAVRLLYDHRTSTIPTITYDPPITKKEISEVSDGIYYFHARAKNDEGWGATSHFKFQIDTQKPEYFTISEIRRFDSVIPRVKFNFDAKDTLSGIDHYEIRIDNGESQIWQDDGTHIFETQPIDPGSHALLVKAVDRAGNFLESSVNFLVAPLESVIITDYPKQLRTGDEITIKTKGPENINTVLFLQKEGDDTVQYNTQSNTNGISLFTINDELSEGSYEAWAQVIDSREAKSSPSERVSFIIKQPAFLKIGSMAISLLAVVIPVVALIFLLIFVSFWLWHKLSLFRRRLKKEVREAETALRDSFVLLKDNIREYMKLLEKAKNKRQLTGEEDKILRKFSQDLRSAEKSVMKEIKDISKQAK